MAFTLVRGRVSHNLSQDLDNTVDLGERLTALLQVVVTRVDVGLHRERRVVVTCPLADDQGGAYGAAGPASAPASGLGEAPAVARRATLAHGTQINSAHSAGTPVFTGRLPRRTIIPLAGTASRSLPAVASHAIGFADH